MAARGRPKLHEDEDLLAAVVQAFASQGYAAVSVRKLSVSLGLSHSALGQRFGTKDELYRTAVSVEFDRFLTEVAQTRARWPEHLEGTDGLRAIIASFLTASARFPSLGQLMNQEGTHASPQLDFIIETVLQPELNQVADLVADLIQKGEIKPVTLRALFFLVAHGAEAPFSLTALSKAFERLDGPLDQSAHIELMVDLIMRALSVDSEASPETPG
jgi:AcrR family transcriptional regulator